MENWKEDISGNYIDLINGFAFKSKNFIKEQVKNSLPVIKIKNVANGDVNLNDVDYHLINESLEKYIISKGDVLIAMTGNHPQSNSQVVGDVSKYKLNTSALLNQRVGKIVSNEKSDLNFIYYLFKNKDTHTYLANQSSGSANQANISKTSILDLELSFPPLPEQKAIAEVLSSLDDKIDLLHRQNETLEEMAQTLFRQWFVERADESWEEIEFGDFLTPQKGKNLTRAQAIDGPYPVVAGGLDPMCTHNMSNTEKPVITISASGANAGFIRLYNQKVWSSDSSFIDKKITPYVYFSYLFLKFNQEILFDRQTGSAQPHIYPKQIMELEFRNYPEHLIIEFDQWCEDLFEKIKFNQIQIQTLEKLRDTLLPKLMSGEVRVKNIDKLIMMK